MLPARGLLSKQLVAKDAAATAPSAYDLLGSYGLADRWHRLRVPAGSPLIDRSVAQMKHLYDELGAVLVGFPEVDVADDDLSIVVRVAALCSSFVTVSNGGITNIIQVIVQNPIATSLYIDAAHAKALPKVAKYLYIDAAAHGTEAHSVVASRLCDLRVSTSAVRQGRPPSRCGPSSGKHPNIRTSHPLAPALECSDVRL